MTFYRITLAILTILFAALSGGIATALTASSSPLSTSTEPLTAEPIEISQALPGQGSIVGELLLGSSSPTVLPSFATTTAAATTTPGLGKPSEHNKVGITGEC